MPAQAGIHLFLCEPNFEWVWRLARVLDSRFRGNDRAPVVMPAQAGIHLFLCEPDLWLRGVWLEYWIPAFAGMTEPPPCPRSGYPSVLLRTGLRIGMALGSCTGFPLSRE
ncbi:MAG TPA: hypothetical protein VGK87_00580 [Anaerolineae bacterium]